MVKIRDYLQDKFQNEQSFINSLPILVNYLNESKKE
jgi:hypothetical protein